MAIARSTYAGPYDPFTKPLDPLKGYGPGWPLGQSLAQAQQQAALRNSMPIAPGWASFAGLSTPRVAGGQPVGGAGGSPNPFTTIANVKNPQVRSILDSILGSVDKAVGADMNQNPYMTRRNILDQGQEARAQEVASSLPGQQAAQQASLADFTRNYLAGVDQATPYQQQEAAAIGEFYDAGPQGVQGRLDSMARDREIAVSSAVQRALDRLQAQSNRQRMISGNSSYLDALGMGASADILAREAVSQADLARQNYLGVKESQANLADRRRQGIDALQRMRLLPIEAQTALTNAQIGQTGAVGDMIRSNSAYRFETPEDVIARQLGLVGQATNIDLANTFYGLNKPYEPDFSGYAVNPYYGGAVQGPATNAGGGGYYGQPTAGYGQPNFQQYPQAVNAYYQTTGMAPQSDPNFSPELWRSLTMPPAVPGTGPYFQPVNYPARGATDITSQNYDPFVWDDSY